MWEENTGPARRVMFGTIEEQRAKLEHQTGTQRCLAHPPLACARVPRPGAETHATQRLPTERRAPQLSACPHASAVEARGRTPPSACCSVRPCPCPPIGHVKTSGDATTTFNAGHRHRLGASAAHSARSGAGGHPSAKRTVRVWWVATRAAETRTQRAVRGRRAWRAGLGKEARALTTHSQPSLHSQPGHRATLPSPPRLNHPAAPVPCRLPLWPG